jgi:hypothetical protein
MSAARAAGHACCKRNDLMKRQCISALLCVSSGLLAAPLQRASAQEAQGCVAAIGPDISASRPATSATDSAATLRIITSVSADEIRFAAQPHVCVRLHGDAKLDSVHVLARRNLATPVVSGTTYRNVYIAVEIIGRLNAECIAARITGAQDPGQKACDAANAQLRRAAPPPEENRRL